MTPVVSIIVANFNGAQFIETALRSALNQTLRDIEVIVGDDGSTDDSVQRITTTAEQDSRLHLVSSSRNCGPGATRNRCIEQARGAWLAVLDSDDLMHPERLERLVAAAVRDGADIAADNLLIFDDDKRVAPRSCLRGQAAAAPWWVDLSSYVRANAMFRRRAALGYLKPILSRELLERFGLRYDPDLPIGEDYDLIVRLLSHGARFRVYPELTYFYRRHAGSTSHRLSPPALEALLDANDRLQLSLAGIDPVLMRALDGRSAMLRRAVALGDLVGAIKQRKWLNAAAIAFRQPRAASLLRMAIAARLRRMAHAGRTSSGNVPATRNACVITRQRVTGRTNGSSAYLLGLCGALAEQGWTVSMVCPTPAVFGRRPVLRLRPEMEMFRSIVIRGSLRLGRCFIAIDPRVWLRASLGTTGAILQRLGFAAEQLTRPAAYAIAAPWTDQDLLFLARNARSRADLILADYAFLAPAIPYVLRPDAPSAVVMHDLFASRPSQFERLGATDSVAAIDLDAEMRLLGAADAVIAIQRQEAEIVRSHLPGCDVLLAPMAVTPVIAPQPGDAPEVLFVGSKTAPNVLGMRWFINEVWPMIRQEIPDTGLVVCGGVGAALGPVPARVETIGYTVDLASMYRRAAVVIAPLPVGSGLKIKLIEALGHGKAVVATTPTLQGVEDDVRAAVVVADQPGDFATAVIRLLRDKALRARYAAAALTVARNRYTARACYADLLAFAARSANGNGNGGGAIEISAHRPVNHVKSSLRNRTATANGAKP